MKYRDFLTLHVLHHANEGPVTGSFMMEELRRHGYRVSPGTIYPLLHSLEGKGLLKGHREVRNGRRVRIYEITERGKKVLEEGRKKLRELCKELLEE
ncbi:PadR family transcriptional regulator [Thermococcus celer]|uniref:PadR family transcriptional regulator n=1 Tax=Thermococcus celer Vu 13 = JCM 8558 TaxID=1293037 RepID=A0A218P033_THECE|nr:PadR family transcriptional regulator [Thermococcus celer]ASI98273.1 PadR family transcriptional regulator [Thermococcus celer Vu 13 = JCM 8558]